MNDFDDLWNEFNEKLLNYIGSKVTNTHDAEDILQDVFVSREEYKEEYKGGNKHDTQ